MTAVRALRPSYIVLPQHNSQHVTVLSFLVAHFTQIPADVWRSRVAQGKVHWQGGELISEHTQYRPATRVYYYREVAVEPKIPFQEQVLYQDDNIVIAYKPHFLVVSPGGEYVNECLTYRLCARLGIDSITSAHRLDRDTAGVILFIKQPQHRHLYHQLFTTGAITKQYHALAKVPELLLQALAQGEQQLPIKWTVKNRLVVAEPSFLQQVIEGEANSHSEIHLVAIKDGIGLFELSPITGKTHQLRVHMQSLGMPILNDRFYPKLAPRGPDDFDKPLALVAKRLVFKDPLTQQTHDVSCRGLGDFSLQR